MLECRPSDDRADAGVVRFQHWGLLDDDLRGVRGQPNGSAQAAFALGGAPVNRQMERSSLSTRRLLDAAGELISEGGYAAMTLAAVGQRAGYGRGLVTARFGSKRELVEALVERITTVWNARNVQPQTVGRSGLDGLLLNLDAIRVQAERDPRALRTLYALQFEALGQVPELRAHFIEFHRAMRADMAGFVRRGAARRVDRRRHQPQGRGCRGRRRAQGDRLPVAARS